MTDNKVRVLAKSALQYFVFIHRTNFPASGFVWVRHPEMLQGLNKDAKVVKLKNWYVTVNPVEFDLFRTILHERRFKTYTEETFKEELASHEQ